MHASPDRSSGHVHLSGTHSTLPHPICPPNRGPSPLPRVSIITGPRGGGGGGGRDEARAPANFARVIGGRLTARYALF